MNDYNWLMVLSSGGRLRVKIRDTSLRKSVVWQVRLQKSPKNQKVAEVDLVRFLPFLCLIVKTIVDCFYLRKVNVLLLKNRFGLFSFSSAGG